MTTNYIIACYGGVERRNPGFYIKHHIDRLNKIRHNLSQVTVMWPEYPGQRHDHKDEYVCQLTALDSGCPIQVIRTKNHTDLWSLYQFHVAMKLYGDKFDYTIFCEDDGFPYPPKFDNKCIDLLELKKVDLLLGHHHKAFGCYSVSTNMVCRGEATNRINSFLDTIRGWPGFYERCVNELCMADMVPQYKIPLWGYKGFIVDHNPFGKLEMFVPWQWWNESVPRIDFMRHLQIGSFTKRFKTSMRMYVGRIISRLELDGSKMKGPLHFDGHLGML